VSADNFYVVWHDGENFRATMGFASDDNFDHTSRGATFATLQQACDFAYGEGSEYGVTIDGTAWAADQARFGTGPQDHRFVALRTHNVVKAIQYSGPDSDEWFKQNIEDWEDNYDHDGQCILRPGVWIIFDRDGGNNWRITSQGEIDREWDIV
jgi:hypothetical protein